MTDTDFKRWFYLPTHNVCVCVPTKCGGTSLYRWAFSVPQEVPSEHVREFAVKAALETGRGPFSPHEVTRLLPDVRRVLAVRDPVDRFMSLWRDKCRRAPGPTLNSTEWLRGWTHEQLLDLIETNPFGDPHWVPQYINRVPGCEIIRFDEMSHHFGYGQRENTTMTDPTDPEPPVRRIRKLYRADASLWRRVCVAQ